MDNVTDIASYCDKKRREHAERSRKLLDRVEDLHKQEMFNHAKPLLAKACEENKAARELKARRNNFEKRKREIDGDNVTVFYIGGTAKEVSNDKIFDWSDKTDKV